MRAPGPAVTIGESIAKEIRTIGSLVLEIWHSQFSPSKLRLFCVYLCFDKVFANNNKWVGLLILFLLMMADKKHNNSSE